MKKFVLSLSLIVAFAFYILFSRDSESTLIVPNSGTNGGQTSVLPPSPAPTPLAKKTYNDGQFVGNVADAYYGNVQIKAAIQNGKITDVQFLQYPNHGGHTMEVSQQVMPMLTSEAIQAQNANVDIISGATQTSQAFRESLGNALRQAAA